MLATTHLIGFGAFATAATAAVEIGNTANAVSATASSAYTFNAQSIGAADAGRYVVVAAGVQGGGGRSISGVTLDGNAMTEVLSQNFDDGNAVDCGLWIVAVPSGATADVVVSVTGGSAAGCGISVFRLVGAASATPTDTAFDTADPINLAIDCPANGAIIGVAQVRYNAAGQSVSWSNLTEAYEADNTGNNEAFTSAFDEFAAAQTALAVAADFSAAPQGMSGVAASWGPA